MCPRLLPVASAAASAGLRWHSCWCRSAWRAKRTVLLFGHSSRMARCPSVCAAVQIYCRPTYEVVEVWAMDTTQVGLVCAGI